VAVPATASTAPGCTRPGRPDAENTRPRLDRCSAHRVRPERPHRPRSRPVFGPPLRQLASDPSVPVEGGSCNDYDYVCGDPVNGRDLDGRCGVLGNPFKKCGPERAERQRREKEERFRRLDEMTARQRELDRYQGLGQAQSQASNAGCRAASLLSFPPTDGYGAAISGAEAFLQGAAGRASIFVTAAAGFYYVFACTPSDPNAPGPFAGSNNVNQAGVPYRQS